MSDLPTIQADLSELEARLEAQGLTFEDLRTDHSSRIEAAHATAWAALDDAGDAATRGYEAEIAAKIYTDQKIQQLRDELGAQYGGIRNYLDGEFADWLQGDVKDMTAAEAAKYADRLDVLKEMASQLGVDLSGLDDATSEIINTTLPQIYNDLAQAKEDLDAAAARASEAWTKADLANSEHDDLRGTFAGKLDDEFSQIAGEIEQAADSQNMSAITDELRNQISNPDGTNVGGALTSSFYTKALSDEATAAQMQALKAEIEDPNGTSIGATVKQNAAAITETDSAIAAIQNTLSTELDGVAGKIRDIQQLDLSSGSAFGQLLNDLEVTSGGRSAKISRYGSAIAKLQEGSAIIGFKAQSGNEVSLLELVAGDGSGGSYSIARISAQDILLDGSVSMRHLAVGDFENYGGGVAFEETWRLGSGVHISDSNSSTIGRYMRLLPGDGSTYLQRKIKCAPGDRFRLEFWCYVTDSFNGSGGSDKFRIEGNSSGHIASIPYIDTPQRETWRLLTKEFAAGDFDTEIAAMLWVRSATRGAVSIGPISIRRMNSGELVVDGTLTGKKFVAKSITAREANFASLSALGLKVYNADISGALSSDNFDHGNSGWRIYQNGNAQFNGVVISRQLQVRSGTQHIDTRFSRNERLDMSEELYVYTGYEVDAWKETDRTFIATVGMNGGAESHGNLDYARWGWTAEVMNLTHWYQSPAGELVIQVKLFTRAIDRVAGTLRWRLYEVT